MLSDDEYNRRLDKYRASKRKSLERALVRHRAKRESTLDAAISKVKEKVRQSSWCSTHGNCFRWYEGETDEHIRAKFERFMEWRKHGATVFTELILKNGKRPDLIICFANGDVFIEEIAVSESEHSLEAKKNPYPFPIKVIRCAHFLLNRP